MFLSKYTNGVYYLYYEDDLGKRCKVSTRCTHKSDALKFVNDFKQGEHTRKARLAQLSLTRFSQEHEQYSKGVHTPKTQEGATLALDQFVGIVGDLPLRKIGVKEIEAFLAKKNADASVWTARKYYIAPASAFETARRWNYVESNPFRRVEKPKTPELQPAHFSKDEFKTLIQAITDQDFKDQCICAVATGLRLGELTALHWSDIDLDRKVLHVRNSEGFTTKSKKNRCIALNEQLRQILTPRKDHATCDLVFHRNGMKLTEDEVSKSLKRYVLQAGLNNKLHFHSLRHTFASWLVEDGVSLYEVQKLLGHSNISVTEVYSHLQPERLHDTVNRLHFALN